MIELKDIINSFIIGILFSLMLNYLFLFLTRKRSFTDILLAVMTFLISFYIFIISDLFFKVFQITDESVITTIKIATGALLSIFLPYSTYIFLKYLTELKGNLFFFTILALHSAVSLSSVIIYLATSAAVYYSRVFPAVMISSIITMMIFTIHYVGLSVYHKKFRKKHFTSMIASFFLILFTILIDRVFRSFHYQYFLNQNYLPIGIAVIIFIYIQSRRQNLRYKLLLKKQQDLENTTINLETIIQERTRMILESNSKIMEADRQKTEFFIKIAHETKNPLSIITNYLNSYIAKYGMNPELKILKANIDKLLEIMLNYLDEEKIFNGQLTLENKQLCNISEALELKISALKDICEYKKISLTVDTESCLVVQADPLGIDIILNNLIENLIKYTDDLKTISIRLNRQNDRVILKVINSGYFFPPESSHPNLFNQENYNTLKDQSHGYGILIIKSILDQINGHMIISCESETDTMFTISLPLNRQDVIDKNESGSCAPDHWNPEPVTHDFSRETVFIIEDNRDLLQFLHSILSQEYNVYYSENGANLMEVLSNIPKPDLILSDIMLKNGNGYDLIDTVKSSQEFYEIPFIFLTAKTTINDKLTGLSKGAVDYIFKPFHSRELLLKISNTIRTARLLRRISENEKFTIAGKLISHIMHEISNPLFGIQGPVEYLKKEFNQINLDHSLILEAFQHIFMNIKRIDSIIKSFKILTYRPDSAAGDSRICDLIDPVLNLFRSKAKSYLIFENAVNPDVTIKTDPEGFTQLLFNLLNIIILTNSGKGSLTLRFDYKNSRNILTIEHEGSVLFQSSRKEGTVRDIMESFNKDRQSDDVYICSAILFSLITKYNWDMRFNQTDNRLSIQIYL